MGSQDSLLSTVFNLERSIKASYQVLGSLMPWLIQVMKHEASAKTMSLVNGKETTFATYLMAHLKATQVENSTTKL